MEKLTEERDHHSTSENREKEQNKRLQRQIRDLKEEMGELAKKETEASRKKHELVRCPAFLKVLYAVRAVSVPAQYFRCAQCSAPHACPVFYMH